MERINRLSKPALSGQATTTMLKKKKQKTKKNYLPSTNLFWEVLRAKPTTGAGNIAMGKLKFLFSTSKSPRTGFQVKASKTKHRDG